MKTKRIICLYGGPGSGKSTTCAGLYYQLKLRGFNAEMSREYVKDWCWEGRKVLTGDQTYFFAKQARKERLYIQQELDFVVTDSPLILTHFYGLKYDPFEQKYNTSRDMLKNHHGFCKDNGYKVDHFFILRDKPYSASGRYQTAEKAAQYDQEIKQMLDEFGIKYHTVLGNAACVDHILNIMEKS